MPSPSLSSSLLAPRHWPTWCGIALAVLFAHLPWPLQRGLGRALGAVLRRGMRSRREVAARNIALCFPEMDAAQQAHLLHEHFAALGIGMFEFARAWWGSVTPMRRNVQIEGLEHLQTALANRRGVILISGHFTTLELCGRLLCDHVPLAGMYRPHAQPALEWAVKRGRLRYATAMFARDELRGAVRHLKQGGILWYAPDQDMLGKDSVFAPFFGLPASTITATHQLARLTGCAVVPFFHRREAGRYRLRLGPAIENFPSADVVSDTTHVNAQIEAMAREAPSQYLWIHRRFKRQPDGRSLYA